jgi:hypothetical protein
VAISHWGVRLLLACIGLVTAFVGYVAWGIEDEYGSGTNFSLEVDGEGPDAHTIVYDVIEQPPGGRVKVFEGTQEDAFAYMDRRRSAGESFVVPGLIIGLGAVLLLAALLPRPRLRRSRAHP